MAWPTFSHCIGFGFSCANLCNKTVLFYFYFRLIAVSSQLCGPINDLHGGNTPSTRDDASVPAGRRDHTSVSSGAYAEPLHPVNIAQLTILSMFYLLIQSLLYDSY